MDKPRRAGGGKSRSFLETAGFAQGVRTRIPVFSIQGTAAGPMAVILAAQHGRELNGVVSIARVFERLDPAKVRGTIVFLPVMNPIAVRARQMDFPLETHRYRSTGITQNMNMNRAWRQTPRAASADQGYVKAVTEVVWKTYLRHADVLLDLHAWPGNSLSLAQGYPKDKALLRAFGLPWHAFMTRSDYPAMASAVAAAAGIPALICELTPQNVICNETVGYGERGILNVLKHSGIVEGSPDLPEVQHEFAVGHAETIIRTDAEGLLVSECRLGQVLARGQVVLRVLSLETLKPLFTFRCPEDGALLFNLGGTPCGEDALVSAVVYPGQMVGLLKHGARILRNKTGRQGASRSP